jgi:hypothetical protein
MILKNKYYNIYIYYIMGKSNKRRNTRRNTRRITKRTKLKRHTNRRSIKRKNTRRRKRIKKNKGKKIQYGGTNHYCEYQGEGSCNGKNYFFIKKRWYSSEDQSNKWFKYVSGGYDTEFVEREPTPGDPPVALTDDDKVFNNAIRVASEVATGLTRRLLDWERRDGVSAVVIFSLPSESDAFKRRDVAQYICPECYKHLHGKAIAEALNFLKESLDGILTLPFPKDWDLGNPGWTPKGVERNDAHIYNKGISRSCKIKDKDDNDKDIYSSLMHGSEAELMTNRSLLYRSERDSRVIELRRPDILLPFPYSHMKVWVNPFIFDYKKIIKSIEFFRQIASVDTRRTVLKYEQGPFSEGRNPQMIQSTLIPWSVKFLEGFLNEIISQHFFSEIFKINLKAALSLNDEKILGIVRKMEEDAATIYLTDLELDLAPWAPREHLVDKEYRKDLEYMWNFLKDREDQKIPTGRQERRWAPSGTGIDDHDIFIRDVIDKWDRGEPSPFNDDDNVLYQDYLSKIEWLNAIEGWNPLKNILKINNYNPIFSETPGVKEKIKQFIEENSDDPSKINSFLRRINIVPSAVGDFPGVEKIEISPAPVGPISVEGLGAEPTAAVASLEGPVPFSMGQAVASAPPRGTVAVGAATYEDKSTQPVASAPLGAAAEMDRQPVASAPTYDDVHNERSDRKGWTTPGAVASAPPRGTVPTDEPVVVMGEPVDEPITLTAMGGRKSKRKSRKFHRK